MNQAMSVKERPILFQGEMVRAILDGRKTQTRRIVKPQPVQPKPDAYFDAYAGGPQWNWWATDNKMFLDQIIKCPYGKPGDHLWVRETARPATTDEYSTVEYKSDGVHVPIQNSRKSSELWFAWRRPEEQYPELQPPKWTPSIHMPRWASRITLLVKDVRVERLQDISEQDAAAEGVRRNHCGGEWGEEGLIEDFASLWESINGTNSWDENPWVWVVEFEWIQ